MSARAAALWYGAGMAGLFTGSLLLPQWRLLFWGLIGLLATVAIALGVMHHRPLRLWPWGALAAAVLFATAGDAVYELYELGAPAWLWTVANVLYLAMFSLAAAALWRLSRSGSAGRNRAGYLDAASATIAAGLAIWTTLVGARAGSLGGAAPTLLGYLAGDLVLLAASVRLVTARRSLPVVRLLATGTLALLASDLLLLIGHVDGPGTFATADVGYLLYYAAWGAAGLHPSMVRLTEPEVLPDWDVTERRAVLVVITWLTGPVVLLYQSVSGGPVDGVLIAVASAAIVVLNLIRLADASALARRFLAHRERHDVLTGLANRALFAEHLAALVAPGADRPPPDAAVLLVDIDGFKLLNDTMGQSVGDEVLVAVARRLAGHLGRRDLAARFGGDEFAVLLHARDGGRGSALESGRDSNRDGLLEDDPPLADLDEVVGRIAAALTEPVTYAGRAIRVTASIGVATAADALTPGASADDPEPDRFAQDLMRHAGLALQAAQAAGRGRWCRYESELHGAMVERMRLRSALDRAVTDGSFVLEYQPIVALESGATVGFEALVRWEHPTRGVIGPAEFIHVAEETGLIEAIGDWVLHRAVTAAAGWHRTMPPGVYVSVNVSAHQLRAGGDGAGLGFAERVDRELTAAGLPPQNLMLELTESVLLDEDRVWAELTALRNAGVRLAIDDFGTGFSSMSYLLQTPIEVIKLDKSFVGSISTSPRQRALVDGIVRLGVTLGLQVIAEGIETADDRDILLAMGCPYGQGFLYSGALGSAEAHRWLAAEASTAPAGAEPSDDAAPIGGDGRAKVPTQPSGADIAVATDVTEAVEEYTHSYTPQAPPGTLP